MTDTKLIKVKFQNGFNKNTTKYDAENYWVDGDKVRFRNGRPEKFGGWVGETVEQFSDSSVSTFTGIVRDIHTWTDLNFNQYFATGSNAKVELFSGNQIYDITPYREELTLTDVITTVDTESEVTITDTNHNLVVGDYVFVDDQDSAVGGITLSGEYTVTEVIDLDNYKIDAGVAATSSASNGGGDLDINYLLEVGDIDNGNVTGYGGGTWDTSGEGGVGYGLPRAGIGGIFLRQWSLDNWGEDLIGCVRNGSIYQWDATSGVGSRMEIVSNAPTQNYIVKVGQPYRHLIAFGTQLAVGGTFDPLLIRWASQETLTEWDITATNTAGEYRLPLGNYIVGVVQTRGEMIIFTDSTVYSMRYVGGNDVFIFDILADNVSAASQHCSVDVNGIIYWMGVDNFYMYDGVVRVLQSSIEEFIYDQDGGGRLNFDQKEKIYCDTNNEFNEIIWLYPSINSLEIDRYVAYNYVEGTWYDGTLDRTVWLDRSIFPKAYAISSTGKLYIHEEGKDDDGSPMYAFLKSGEVDLDDGTDLMFVDRFIPDFKLVPNRNANLYLTLKKYPNSSGVTKGPYTFNNSTQKISLRARARQISVMYEVDTIGSDFEVGSPRFGIIPDGGR